MYINLIFILQDDDNGIYMVMGIDGRIDITQKQVVIIELVANKNIIFMNK